MRITEYGMRIDHSCDRAILVKESARNIDSPNRQNRIYGPGDVIWTVEQTFDASNRAEEHVWVLCLNTKHKVMGVFEHSRGTVAQSIISPREIFSQALMIGACGIIVVHNHPSGDVTPSQVDIDSTSQLVQAGKILGVPVLDHIIIGKDSYGTATYYSFKEEDRLK